jgi:hypothetical protein
MMIEAVNIYQTTRHHIPEASNLHSHRCKNLKSHGIDRWSKSIMGRIMQLEYFKISINYSHQLNRFCEVFITVRSVDYIDHPQMIIWRKKPSTQAIFATGQIIISYM